jgi:hypothetical protein
LKILHQFANLCLLSPNLAFPAGVLRVLGPAAVAELDAALAVDVLAPRDLLHPDGALGTPAVV